VTTSSHICDGVVFLVNVYIIKIFDND